MKITLWTDGSGTHSGPGGWAYVLQAVRDGQVVSERVGHGGCDNTTSQRMELTAVIEGLLALKRCSTLTVWTDSEYVKKGATSWLPMWIENGWRTREGDPVRNMDLWEDVAAAKRLHRITWEWIKGHAKNYRCECGWDGIKPPGQRAPLRCPRCDGRTKSYDRHPINARCDVLAGQERQAIIEVAAMGQAAAAQWTNMRCPTCGEGCWGVVGATECRMGHPTTPMIPIQEAA